MWRLHDHVPPLIHIFATQRCTVNPRDSTYGIGSITWIRFRHNMVYTITSLFMPMAFVRDHLCIHANTGYRRVIFDYLWQSQLYIKLTNGAVWSGETNIMLINSSYVVQWETKHLNQNFAITRLRTCGEVISWISNTWTTEEKHSYTINIEHAELKWAQLQ